MKKRHISAKTPCVRAWLPTQKPGPGYCGPIQKSAIFTNDGAKTRAPADREPATRSSQISPPVPLGTHRLPRNTQLSPGRDARPRVSGTASPSRPHPSATHLLALLTAILKPTRRTSEPPISTRNPVPGRASGSSLPGEAREPHPKPKERPPALRVRNGISAFCFSPT